MGATRLRHQFSLRARLTLLYWVAFVAAGGLLITVMYNIAAFSLRNSPSVAGRIRTEKIDAGQPAFVPMDQQLAEAIAEADAEFRSEVLSDLLQQSLTALAIVSVLAMGAGYLLAGRALRPISEITATAQRVAASSLHERIALQGPRDEVRRLADTFDEMLARLDAAFDSQRQFVANASHELRTPLAIERTALDVALSTARSDRDWQDVAQLLLENNTRSQEMIDGLLTLARSERELEETTQVDLQEVLRAALGECNNEIDTTKVRISLTTERAPVTGDRKLLERLVHNLVVNSVRHNQPSGQVWIKLARVHHEVVLDVENTGERIDDDIVPSLFEPFRRGRGARVESARGSGLGMSIIRAVAHAHGGRVSATARPEGGLRVRVALPGADERATHT